MRVVQEPAGRLFALMAVAVLGSAALTGCRDGADADQPVVTLYSSVDEEFARQIVAAFEQKTGIKVQLRVDKETAKTTGLVRRIEGERSHPQADVFWNSELFHTIEMARKGLLAEYRPPAKGIPDRYKDANGRWTAIGLRARVVAYNTDEVKREDLPKTWRDLNHPRWTGKLGVADPVFGTTRGHFAAMLALWGEAEYTAFLAELKTTLAGPLMPSNSAAAQRVGDGDKLICSTDTDDVYVRQRQNKPIDMVYPDMGDGGTLLIPNSVAMIAGAPHPETAKKLIEFLTSAEAERMLAESDSGNFPVRPELRDELGMELPPETKVAFDAIADAMPKAIRLASQILASN